MRVPPLKALIQQEQEKLQEEPIRTYVELLMSVLEHKEPLTVGDLWDLCVFSSPLDHQTLYLNVLSGYGHEFGLASADNTKLRSYPLDNQNLVSVISKMLEAASDMME